MWNVAAPGVQVDWNSPIFFVVGRTLRNIRRLTLRLGNGPFEQPEIAFWARLNRAFPLLTTLFIVTNCWGPEEIPQLEDNEVTCLERLEILYFSCPVTYSGCYFPRLRHASIWKCTQPQLEILTRSPHLESLLIRAYLHGHTIDVTSCLHLKLLGFPECSSLIPLGSDHPVEHIWLYSNYFPRNPDLFEQFLSYDSQYCWRRTRKLPRVERCMAPSENGDLVWVIERERVATGVSGGVIRNMWSKMCG